MPASLYISLCMTFAQSQNIDCKKKTIYWKEQISDLNSEYIMAERVAGTPPLIVAIFPYLIAQVIHDNRGSRIRSD